MTRTIIRPRLETLEDRTLMSTCHVTRLDDAGIGGPRRNTGDLRYCINLVNALPGPDVIDFAVTGTIQLNRPLPSLTGIVDVLGPGANLLTVRRNAGGNYRIFYVSAGAEVTVAGLTLTNGFVLNEPGGGVYNDGILTLDGARISFNTSQESAGATARGGGIYNAGTLTINDSTITGNSASMLTPSFPGLTLKAHGGGIYNATGAFLSIGGSSVIGNHATATTFFIGSADAFGGGIYNATGATLAIDDTSLRNNEAHAESPSGPNGRGGGVVNFGAATIRALFPRRERGARPWQWVGHR